MSRVLLVLVLSALALSFPNQIVHAQKLKKQKVLFENEDWYKRQKGKEKSFVGILSRVKGGGGIGFGRFNPYRLTITTKKKKSDVREVYVGGKRNLLDPYVGKRVRITGKAVNMSVEGQFHREIWPASVGLVKGGKKKGKQEAKGGGEQLKVYATTRWPYARAIPNKDRKGKQFVMRKQADLFGKVQMPRVDTPTKEQWLKLAEKKMAKAFGRKKIDWDKQMIVVVTAGSRPTGGYRMTINSLRVKNKKLHVTYTVTPPRGIATQAFTHPAIMALVERFDGPIEFQMKSGRGKLRPRPGRPIRPIRPKLPRPIRQRQIQN